MKYPFDTNYNRPRRDDVTDFQENLIQTRKSLHKKEEKFLTTGVVFRVYGIKRRDEKRIHNFSRDSQIAYTT
jgi:hypothetical protein